MALEFISGWTSTFLLAMAISSFPNIRGTWGFAVLWC